MTPLQLESERHKELCLELTRLIGKKELTFGCLVTVESSKGQKRIAQIVDYSEKGFATFVSNGNIMTLTPNNRTKSQWKIVEILNHPATLSDFHRFLIENKIVFLMGKKYIDTDANCNIPYDSSLGLLEQSDDTLKQIISLITNNQ